MSLGIDSDDEKLKSSSRIPNFPRTRSLGTLSTSNVSKINCPGVFASGKTHTRSSTDGDTSNPKVVSGTGNNMSQLVTLNVSGTRYEVARATLAMYPRTMLGRLVSSEWHKPDQTEIFIDRDPERFRYILDWYRDHEIHIPLTMSKEEILKDVRFFCLPLTENDIFFKTCNVQDLCAVKEAADLQFQKTYDKLRSDADIALARSTALNTIAHLLKKAYHEPHVSSFEVSPRKFSPKCKFYNTKFWTIFEKFALDLAKDAGFKCEFPNTYDGMVCVIDRIPPTKEHVASNTL